MNRKDELRRLHLPVISDEGAPARPPQAWRSLEELSGAPPAEGEGEFPPGASELPEGPTRRAFMGLLSATALAGAGISCRPSREPIVPYVRRPPGVIPGIPLTFATAHVNEGYGRGLLVSSYEGRPTKIEGNPEHPSSLGATTAIDQALLLGLYDQDRETGISWGGRPVARRQLAIELAQLMRRSVAEKGARLRFLVEPTSSPTIADLRRRLLERQPEARFVAWSGAADNAAHAGTRIAFGRPLEVRHHLVAADVILSLDADFLDQGPEQVRLSREFAGRRTTGEPAGRMNRLYVVEPALTPTGMMADHRLRLSGAGVAAFARALAAELGGRSGLGMLAPFGQQPADVDRGFLRAVADDLLRARGACVVIVGPRQPAAVHALAAALNVALGNVGTTVTFGAPPLLDAGGAVEPLTTLAQELEAGVVDTLVITARNPVYTAPVDLDMPRRIKRARNAVYHSLYRDETAAVVNNFIPAAHVLESWGDTRAPDGTATLIQPLIDPIWGGVQELDLWSMLLEEPQLSAYDLLLRFWRGRTPGVPGQEFPGAWQLWLAAGVVPDTAFSAESVELNAGAVRQALAELAVPERLEGMEIAFALDPKVHDGRYANNAFLQELPHPITKLTWGNGAMISPATALRLRVETGDVLSIEHRGETLLAPVMVTPGHADATVTLPLGYGRAGGESVGRAIGFNAGVLRRRDALWFAPGARVTRTGARQVMAFTQNHFRMHGRGIALQGQAEEVADPHSHLREALVLRREPLPALYDPFGPMAERGHMWGMGIDLGRCTGCSACVVACQTENNVPVVGKVGVERAREMHWLRIDNYFEGPLDEPTAVSQPMLCQHCEYAPCEYVCPVNATLHSPEGLNEMVYNRCVGTRYCSNNCPYKVRRFNYLNYAYDGPAVDRLRRNPEVTVRSRGVMEKCTFCVQRIQRARIAARITGNRLDGNAIETACSQVCPTRAIVFGSLTDPDAPVTRMHHDPRHYYVLHELGTRPRIAYLAKLRNPHPALAGRRRPHE